MTAQIAALHSGASFGRYIALNLLRVDPDPGYSGGRVQGPSAMPVRLLPVGTVATLA